MFGPLQAAGHAYAAVVPAFVAAALAGEPVTVHGDGGQTRDFTYVGSVCEVISAAVAAGVTSDRPVNLAFGGRSSLLELLAELEAVLGHPIERTHVEPRGGDVRDSQADQTNLRALFPVDRAGHARGRAAPHRRVVPNGGGDMKVLVTGAAGFIGSQLAETLAAAGDDVVGIDAMTDYYDVGVKRAHVASLTEAGVRFVEADLRYSDLAPFVEGVQVVHHQAAQPGVRNSWAERFTDYDGHNILGTQRLLEAARHAGVHRFVYASSSSVYGNAATYPTIEETVPAPFSPSGVTKLAAEHLCRAYALNFGLATVALRYFTVYGPRQRPDMSIHRLIEAALDGTSFPRFGDGTQVRELTHVTDAIVAARLGAVRGGQARRGVQHQRRLADGAARPHRARRGRGGGADRRRGPPGRARRRAAQRRLDRAGPRAARLATVRQPAGRHPQPGGLAPRPSPLTLSAGAGAP